MLRGLRIEHFYETAVTILGGVWALEDCEVVSSRAPARACVGVVLRGLSAVEVLDTTISGCSSAVLLSSTHARLFSRHTTFANARSAIEALRGGRLDVQHCAFDVPHSCDVGMRVAADTAGVVLSNRASGNGSLWGRLDPPSGVIAEEGEHEEGQGAEGGGAPEDGGIGGAVLGMGI